LRLDFHGFCSGAARYRVGGQGFLESLAANPITLSGKIGVCKGRPEIGDLVGSADGQRVSILRLDYMPRINEFDTDGQAITLSANRGDMTINFRT
jgi:hypothetical protein